MVMSARGGPSGLVQALRSEIVEKPFEMLKLGAPSLLYLINNIFMFVAISALDAATFQLTYQVKILIAATIYSAAACHELGTRAKF